VGQGSLTTCICTGSGVVAKALTTPDSIKSEPNPCEHGLGFGNADRDDLLAVRLPDPEDTSQFRR
jgi:hypothetical protein